jgi:hypothetical protein
VGTVALGALAACGGGPKDELHDPVPLEEHKIKIAADAEGTIKSPAHVAVFLQRGSLRITGGAESTVEGFATGGLGDPPPRVELALDRVAIVQSIVGGAPPKGYASFVLSLGKTPMALEVENGSGQAQSIDLGGVAIVQGRFHTESGHLTIDWSAPNALPSGALTLQTEKGYIDVTHLGQLGGGTVTVKTVEGVVNLDVGSFAGSGLVIDADVGAGKLVLKVPRAVPARAEVTGLTSASAVVAPEWRAAGDAYVLGDANAAPRVVLHARGGAAAHVDLGVE